MPNELLAGLRRFHSAAFPRFRDQYRRLAAEGQRPRTLFIGCADSRVIPELITDAGPGDLFTVRNVGNLVPPYDVRLGHHGTSAAIEYAVLVLGVTDIVVCGHTHCGAIRALYSPPAGLSAATHIGPWIELARPAALDEEPTDQVLRRTEQRSVALQLERVLTYPMVRTRVEAGQLFLHGWHFSIEEGSIRILDLAAGEFVLAERD